MQSLFCLILYVFYLGSGSAYGYQSINLGGARFHILQMESRSSVLPALNAPSESGKFEILPVVDVRTTGPTTSTNGHNGEVLPTKVPVIVGLNPATGSAGELIKIIFDSPIVPIRSNVEQDTQRKSLLNMFSVRFGDREAVIVDIQDNILSVFAPKISNLVMSSNLQEITVFFKGHRIQSAEGFRYLPNTLDLPLESKKEDNLKSIIRYAAIGFASSMVIFWASWLFFRRRNLMLDRSLKKAGEEIDFLRQETNVVSDKFRPATDQLPQEGVSLPARLESDRQDILPEIPEELLASCAKGQCVLYIGNGISAYTGRPTWRELVARILDQLSKEQPGHWERLQSALRDGRTSQVAEILVSRIERSSLITKLHAFYGQELIGSTDVWRTLANIPFSNVVAGTWDPFVEEAFRHRNPTILTPWSTTDLWNPKRFSLVRLWGDLRTSQICFTSDEYRQVVADNPEWSKYVSTLLTSQQHLFLGAGLPAIESYLQGSRETKSSILHYAVVPLEDAIELEKERFLGKYNVHLIVFKPSAGWHELRALVETLEKNISSQLSAETLPQESVQPAVLERVVLHNIGPFVEEEITLDPNWNVVLGNNGSGKSTFLKAIALGLCGDDPKTVHSAKQLLRVGQQSGIIELWVGKELYRTELFRQENGNVRVLSRQITPLRLGRWAVLGFPPLRGVAFGNPAGPTPEHSSRPTVDDLLPLLEGGVDERMRDLKQWLVNLDVKSVPGNGVTIEQSQRASRKREAFFNTLAKLVHDTKLEFASIDRQSWVVNVQTDDGVVPIEQVSQGMSSTIGWLGTLIERLYEIHGDCDVPELEPAIVLIDEIDAHLHPEWQQILSDVIPNLFKNVQFIVTTHSPLVVSSLQAGQILRAYRDTASRRVHIERPAYDVKGWHADEILTDPLFGLETPGSLETHRDISRYVELACKPDLAEEEANALNQLSTKLKVTPPSSQSRSKANEAYRMVEETFDKRWQDMDPSHRQQLVSEIKAQIHGIVGEERDST